MFFMTATSIFRAVCGDVIANKLESILLLDNSIRRMIDLYVWKYFKTLNTSSDFYQNNFQLKLMNLLMSNTTCR